MTFAQYFYSLSSKEHLLLTAFSYKIQKDLRNSYNNIDEKATQEMRPVGTYEGHHALILCHVLFSLLKEMIFKVIY